MVDVVEFQVLGPLRVEDGGEAFPLGGPKQRAVLALLVASAGSPVPTDTLLMGIYGPDADPASRRTLHTYISRYRGSFGDVIERRGDAYALLADHGSIDALRFESAVQRAESLVEPAEAAQHLRDALGLWRGRPYADITTPALDPEVRRLEELRAQTIEARVALDLAAGRHRELLAELEVLVAEYPLREQLRAHQMLALYRSGRQHDALKAYRSAATHLRDELGLDPSPKLQRLEAQILEQDAELDFHPRPVRRPLPSRYTSFVGRTRELAEVRALIDRFRLVTITGPGGVGKSSLAAEAARAYTDRVHVVFVPIEAERQETVAMLIAQSLGLQPADGIVDPSVLIGALGDDPTLLVLDGCEHVIEELPPLVDEILKRAADARVLVTSREPLLITGERRIVLEPLPVGVDSPATDLLIERGDISRARLDCATRETAARIAERVSGLPLGIELAAARLRSMTLDEIADQLDDQMRLLASKRGPEPRHLSIVNALEWSHVLLDEPQQRAFRSLSVFVTGMIPVDGAAVVLGMEDPAEMLDGLVDLSLLTAPDNQGRYRFLEPIRQYAASKLDEAAETRDVATRYAGWLVDVAWDLHRLVLNGHAELAFPRLRSQAPAIAAAVEWAIAHDEPDIALDLVAAVGRMWRNVADPRILRDPAMRALETLDDPLGDTAMAALAQTATLYRLDEPAIARQLGDRAAKASVHMNNPVMLQIVNSALVVIPYGSERSLEPAETKGALAWWEKSAELLAELGYPVEADYRNAVMLLLMLDRKQEADSMLRAMLDFASESRPVLRGHALELLSSWLMEEGRTREGLEAVREASRLLIDGGDLDFASEAERRRAVGHAVLNEYKEAQRALTRHDELHQLIGLPPIVEEEPLLVAATAAGLERWDDFAVAMRVYADSAPDPGDDDRYARFLRGEADRLEHYVHMIAPMARWLMSRDRRDAAAALVAAAPKALQESAFTLWEEVGDVDRINLLAAELEDVEPSARLATLDDVWRFMLEWLDVGLPPDGIATNGSNDGESHRARGET